MRRNAKRTLAYLADDVVSVHMYSGAREIIDGFTKNMFSILGRSLVWTAVSLAGGVVFHIVPYVLAFAGNAVAIAIVCTITVTRVILFAALRYPLMYALLAHPLMVAFWGIISIRSAWVVGIRKTLTWRGRLYDPEKTTFGSDR
jgi:hypothetical protein